MWLSEQYDISITCHIQPKWAEVWPSVLHEHLCQSRHRAVIGWPGKEHSIHFFFCSGSSYMIKDVPLCCPFDACFPNGGRDQIYCNPDSLNRCCLTFSPPSFRRLHKSEIVPPCFCCSHTSFTHPQCMQIYCYYYKFTNSSGGRFCSCLIN